MSMDANSEIMMLAKTCPWAVACFWTLKVICKTVAPLIQILAVRLARNAQERAALLKMFEVSNRKERSEASGTY